MTEKLSVPAPDTPCGDCINSPEATARHEQTGIVAVYCPHNFSGALYMPRCGYWHSFSPVDEQTFAAIVSSVPSIAANVRARRENET